MKLIWITVLLLLTSVCSRAQHWNVRLSLSYLQCGSNVDRIYWDSKQGLTTITPYTLVFGEGQFLDDYLGNKIPEISVIYQFNSKHGLMASYIDLNGYIGYTVKTTGTKDMGVLNLNMAESAGSLPGAKLNYVYTFFEKKNYSFSLVGGPSLFFKGHDSRLKNTWLDLPKSGKIEQPVNDQAGNPIETIYYEYHTVKHYRPNPIIPAFNFGCQGEIKLNRRFCIGIKADYYFSTKTPYATEIYGETNDTKLIFKAKMKQHFFSLGLYTQYRIK